MPENGLDLKQVHNYQDPNFFIDKGIKIGIARRFVENIGKWIENLKKTVAFYDIRLDRILSDEHWAFCYNIPSSSN